MSLPSRCLASVGLALLSTSSASALTIIVDFKAPGELATTAASGDRCTAFDITTYGFAAGQFGAFSASVIAELNRDYKAIPTQATDIRSPIPAGKELAIDFLDGNIGSLPSNGDSEYYYVQVGRGISGLNYSTGTLGVANVSAARSSTGVRGLTGQVVGSIFTNNILTLANLTPSNALTIGNLAYTTYAIEGTLAHEVGHALSLSHVAKAGAVTPSGFSPLMGTGAIDLPNQDRITDREFSYSGVRSDSDGGIQNDVAQLVGAIGLRDVVVPEPGSVSVAAGAAGLLLSRFRRKTAARRRV